MVRKKKISRRTFVKTAGATLCSMPFAAGGAWAGEEAVSAGEGDPSGGRVAGDAKNEGGADRDDGKSAGYPDIVFASGEAGPAVRKAMETIGGMARFVKPGARVLLKPNMGFANPPEWTTTTNPAVVRAVAELVIEAGAKSVFVCDNPNRKPEQAPERSGIASALDGLDKVRVFLVNRPRDFREVPVPEGKVLSSLSIATLVSKVDLLINIPVAKHHNATGVSFGMKNLMGLISDRTAFHTKFDLHDAIADMNRVIKPGLTILDAMRILTSGGPAGPGRTVDKGMVIAGRNP